MLPIVQSCLDRARTAGAGVWQPARGWRRWGRGAAGRRAAVLAGPDALLGAPGAGAARAARRGAARLPRQSCADRGGPGSARRLPCPSRLSVWVSVRLSVIIEEVHTGGRAAPADPGGEVESAALLLGARERSSRAPSVRYVPKGAPSLAQPWPKGPIVGSALSCLPWRDCRACLVPPCWPALTVQPSRVCSSVCAAGSPEQGAPVVRDLLDRQRAA
jgi:hypothetical protein